MSIFWGEKKHIEQLHKPQRIQVNNSKGHNHQQHHHQQQRRRRQPEQQRQQQEQQQQQHQQQSSTQRPRSRPRSRSELTDRQSNHQSVQIPETNLTSVLHALVGIVRKQLTQPPQRPLFVPPKHLGYATEDQDATNTSYYPLSVLKEDTNTYFRNKELAEIAKVDRDGRKQVLKKVQTSSADNQRYPFDRSAGDYIRNALDEEEEKKKEEQRKVEAVSESREQITALRAEGAWIKQQKQGMEHRIQRLEHLLSLLQHEQKTEISREMRIIEGAKKSSNQMEEQLEEMQKKVPKNAGLDTGAVREHRQMVATIQAERSDTADRIMRILQDYDLISGAQMATYLMKSLQNVTNAPNKAQATFEASLSGITNPDNLISRGNSLTSGSMGSHLSEESSSGALAFMSMRKKSGADVPAAGLGSDLMRTPRGRYAPIVTDSEGVVSHMGFGKQKNASKNGSSSKNGSAVGRSRSSTALSSISSSSSTTTTQQGRISTAEESDLLTHTNRVNMPNGPMSRRGRALMYRNYRSLLVEETANAAGESVGTEIRRFDFSGASRGTIGTSGTLGSNTDTQTIEAVPTTAPVRPRGLRDLAPNWYPHMGTMPAPVGIAERALRDPTDPNAGKRDGRGLPPEEVLPDDDQPFEGRVRWFAKKDDLNFYPMLTAPSFSRSFAADKIIRKMLEEDKTPKTMTGMPAYRLSMPMAGARTYGESANSFSFLVGRPLQPLQ